MTNAVTQLLSAKGAAPALPGNAARVDTAATGGFARVLDNVALEPAALEAAATPLSPEVSALSGQAVLLEPAPTAAGLSPAATGSDGQPLPVLGNLLPPAGQESAADAAGLAALTDTLETAVEPAAALAADDPRALTDAADALAPDPSLPDTPLEITAAPAPVVAAVPVPVAGEALRGVADRGGPRGSGAAPSVATAVAATTVPASDVAAPPIAVATSGLPTTAAQAEAAGIEAAVRPDAAARIPGVDGSAGSAAQDLSARLAPLDTAAPLRTAATESVARMTIDQPLSSPGWSDALGRRVLVMADTRLRVAEVRLDPPELGPIEIRLSIRDDKAQVAFQAQHALTRDALESAMPRLREMLAEQGLVLSQATVSDQSAGEGWRSRDGQPAPAAGPDDAAADAETRPALVAMAGGSGLVDEYA